MQNLWDKLKDFFKLTKVRRFVILGITAVLTILTITLGSVFYVSQDSRLGIEYGGGAEYVIQVNPNSEDANASNAIADSVAQSIYERIDSLGVSGAVVEAAYGSGGEFATIRIQYPGVTTQEEVDQLESLITNKPTLTLTDIYGNPLFDARGNSNFNQNSTTPTSYIVNPEDINYQIDSSVPITANGANISFDATSGYQVVIELDSEASRQEWAELTTYVSSLEEGQNTIATWINLDQYIDIAQTQWNDQWIASNYNPIIFSYVDNNPENSLKLYQVDASQYLISIATISSPLTGNTFVISGNFTRESASLLAQRINYGAADYSLETLSSNYVDPTYGTSSFQSVLIAGLIIMAIIAIFLIGNYGLLGLVATFSISIYLFLTLTLFTLLNGEYSPETLASLIIGIGISVDANIITFERLKTEIYGGSSVTKAGRRSFRQTFWTIFDANITTLIVAFVLFYFGTRTIVGLSITLIISIFLTLVITLGFTRFASTMLINTEVFEKRKHLVGIIPQTDKFITKNVNRINFVSKSKWAFLSSGVVFGVALIVFIAFIGITGSFSGGFNLSQDFTGGSIIDVSQVDNSILTGDTISSVTSVFEANGIQSNEIELIPILGSSDQIQSIQVDVNRDLDLSQIRLDLTNILDTSIFRISSFNTSIATANALVRDALIAIGVGIILIFIYTIIRFNWTYSIAAIITLIHDSLLVIGLFIMFRIEISPIFVAALLATIGYSINDTIVIFDKIREQMKLFKGNITPKEIRRIANKSIQLTFKRSMYTSLTTIIAILILMAFGNATPLNFNLAMLFGLIIGTYSSIFIATAIWRRLEIIRLRWQKNRIKRNFWKTGKVEEQVFIGINDFKQ